MKSRRNKKACDNCSRRSVRCQPSTIDGSKCQSCMVYAEPCTYLRPTKKRGAKPKTPRTEHDLEIADRESGLSNSAIEETSNLAVIQSVTPGQVQARVGDTPWRPPTVYNQAQVVDLTEIYLEVVFPVFPFFHRSTLRRRVARSEHLEQRPFYAAISALCSLSAARARDGATYSTTPNAQRGLESETYFKAAEEAIPADAILAKDFNYMRAAALLAITSIQYGKPDWAARYIAIYNSYLTVSGFHSERNWPSSLDFVQVEEGRRLFWSMYTLDIFASIAWSGIASSREALFDVEYPSQIDDDYFDSSGPLPQSPMATGMQFCWIQGWNFVTDLYCILEHSIDQLRSRQASRARSWLLKSFDTQLSRPSRADILQQVDTMYDSLPDIFKTTTAISRKLSQDIFSFQAANIAATVQLVRMVYLTNGESSLAQKCSVASEVIGSFSTVPVIYLRAISSPLLYHLAGIGSIFSAAFHAGMTESEYNQIRVVLVQLADLLESLESGLFCTPGTCIKLRSQVTRIDEYMIDVQTRAGLQPTTQRSSNGAHGTGNMASYASDVLSEESPQYHFPPELLEHWSWGLDLVL